MTDTNITYIIRCKDCIYMSEPLELLGGLSYCSECRHFVTPTDFCCWAKSKDKKGDSDDQK